MSRTILITGCSSGLGHHAARHLASAGHHVFAGMRDVAGRNRDAADGLRAWAGSEGSRLEVVELDVSSDASVAGAFRALPPLDVVVNNAGLGFMGPAESLTPDQFAAQLDVNLVGAFRIMRAALPAMRERGSGLILQVSSLSGRAALVGDAFYSASKFGLEGLSEGMRYELGPLGIDVVLMEPGPFATDFGANVQSAVDGEVASAYGHVLGFAEAFQKMHGEMAQDPGLFSEALERVIDSPAGERPLRVIPGMDFGLQALNDGAEAVRQRVMSEMGLADWDGAKGNAG
jgi:NAD(P)-dependent dehydrogenase (short-subunit alcohol dehydrogenase family)